MIYYSIYRRIFKRIQNSIILLFGAAVIFSCVLPGDVEFETIKYGVDVEGDSSLWFDDTKLHEIRIKMDPAVLEQMLEDGENPDDVTGYRLAEYFTFNNVRMNYVGIKCRGGTTADAGIRKKSLKLKFDCVNPFNTGAPESANQRFLMPENENRQFYDVEEVNLRTSPNDPSLIRDFMAYKMYREAGVPAPRASMGVVYINDEPYGVYTIAEQPTKRMLKNWFANNDGNLYKCGWTWGGGASFRAGTYDPERYRLQTNKSSGDVSDIQNLLSVVESIDNKSKLSAQFHIGNLAAYVAVSSFTGHWDSLAGNLNNDYVYHNPENNLWYLSVWDCDNTFGSDWGDINTLIYDWNILSDNSGSRAEFVNKLYDYAQSELKSKVGSILSRYDGTSRFENEALRVRDLIKNKVKTEDSSIAYNNFIDSFYNEPPGMNNYPANLGLITYFNARLANIKAGYNL